MKAIVATRRGGPEVLEMQDVPDPQPNAAHGDVIVDIEAVGVNFADTVQTQGMYPHGPKWPYVPGLEFAGKISGTNDRVMGLCAQGAYAPKIAVPRAALFPVPARWSAEEAAAFLVNYLTAYLAYWMAGMTDPGAGKGKSVLIHAVAGGVGTAAVEIGTLLGVEMYGTSSADNKLAKAKALGLQHGINYKTKEYEEEIGRLTGGKGVDAVFEMLGGEHTATSTRCLKEMGSLIVYGMATGQAPQFDFMTMFVRNLIVRTLGLFPIMQNQELVGRCWQQLSAWVTAGKLKPQVGTTLPLGLAAEAHRMMLERRNYGKVVLVPGK
jgi:NADPH:quinone reductase